VRFLQGLTTVNVEQLADGGHAWGAILNPKGRVLSVIDIARIGETMIVACEGSLAEPTRAILERYAVMDDVVFEPVEGPAHQTWTEVASVWIAPIVEGAGDGAVADTEHAAELLRIRSGFLRYGIDVDDGHFPFETPLVKLLDYTKGCYVGQEPVFRVHAQGQSQRMLRGLRVDGEGPVTAGAVVVHPAKARAGGVTSTTVSPRLGPIALAMVHRTAWTPGDRVEVEGRSATVVELPFADVGW
jgi:folate-binding protein YgfZ